MKGHRGSKRRNFAHWGAWKVRTFTSHECGLRANLCASERWLDHAFVNLIYSVQVSEFTTSLGVFTHLWIKRHKGDATSVPWSSKQRIKDDLIGPERVAIEVFPAASELVDSADMYHLWVLPEGEILPFALQ